MTSGLGWKWSRLRSMSPAEVAWRLDERLSLTRLRARAGQAPPPLARPREGFLGAFRASSAVIRPPGDRIEFANRLAALAPDRAQELAREAGRTRAGRVELFARRYDFGPDLARWPWNRSPDGGPEVPLAFGPTLDYRVPERVGNARLAWELARAGWTAAPAMAAYLDASDPAENAANARFAFEALEAFDRACPVYRGLQWSSALEMALRSLSWGWALSLVAVHPAAEEIEDARWGRLFASWAEAMRFVEAHDSRHSSANNHRLGEAAGLAWAGHALSFLPESARWRDVGLERLERALLDQTTEFGVTREHAFAYQQFVLDFVIAVEAVAMRAGRALPLPIAERMVRVAVSLDAFSPGRREVWPVGDGDEGRALHLAEPWEERVLATLATAAVLLHRRPGGPVHERSLWLGLEARSETREHETGNGNGHPALGVAGRGPQLWMPPESGYGVVNWSVGGRAARLLFDSAPLGLPPLYAHAHADALMVLLDVDGPRLVDPGTGAYHSDPELRERLRSARSHNTVEVGGRDPWVKGGLFQWLRPTGAWDADPLLVQGGGLIGERKCDRRGRFVSVHRRIVEWLEPDAFVVTDLIECGSPDRAVARWHVGDGTPEVLPDRPGHVRVRWPDGIVLTLAGIATGGMSLRVAAPTVWAPRFLEPRPCGVLEIVADVEPTAALTTVVGIGELTFDYEPTTRGLELVVEREQGEPSRHVCSESVRSIMGTAALRGLRNTS